jgi:hypothetical protein|tara:strand:+ start:2570 stop:2998 length:429 start_codon:yes stop_codon:yes gene_type:complete
MIKIKELPATVVSRFLKKIDSNSTNCHLWQGTIDRSGYGVFCVGRNKETKKTMTISAHKFAYLLHRGEIHKEKIVIQECENNLCVKPEHLVLKNRKEWKRVKPTIDYLRKIKKIRPDLIDDANILIRKLQYPKDEYDFGFDN